MLVAISLFMILGLVVSSFLISNIRHNGQVQGSQVLATQARAYMEAARVAWAGADYGNVAKLPAAPEGCEPAVSPSPNITAGGKTITLKVKPITLDCERNGLKQMFSLEIPQP